VISLYVAALEAREFEDRLASLERADCKLVEHVGGGAPVNNESEKSQRDRSNAEA
jgi:hypothetical protein